MSVTLPFVLPSVGAAPNPAYVLTPCLMRPKSRGSVRLASADPRDPPLIDPAFLTEPDDLDVMAEAIAIARDVGAAREFADWRKREVHPGPGPLGPTRACATSPGAPRTRSTIRSAPAGWERPDAVVDLALRVRGMQGLRVVDASVMPSLPQAMVNAATIAIAERASELIRNRS